MARSHELPSQDMLEHRLKEVERELARAEKSDPEHVRALERELKKLKADLAD